MSPSTSLFEIADSTWSKICLDPSSSEYSHVNVAA